MREYWTDQQLNRLKTLWPNNSAAVVSRELGRSRSAVLAKASRLGLLKGRGGERTATSARLQEQLKFERVVDAVAEWDGPSVAEAGLRVGLGKERAEEMWRAFCARFDGLSVHAEGVSFA